MEHSTQGKKSQCSRPWNCLCTPEENKRTNVLINSLPANLQFLSYHGYSHILKDENIVSVKVLDLKTHPQLASVCTCHFKYLHFLPKFFFSIDEDAKLSIFDVHYARRTAVKAAKHFGGVTSRDAAPTAGESLG